MVSALDQMDDVALDDGLRAAIRRIARMPHLLVCTDYDGTVAPIVDDPTTARPLPETIAALRSLSVQAHTTVAVISGRALRDLAALSRLPGEIHLVGSHGSEFDIGFVRALDAEAGRRRTALIGAVRGLVDGIPGVQLEEKPASVAVHVRRATRDDAQAVLEALAVGPGSMSGVHTTAGHEVLELSVVESDKGMAIDTLRHQVGASAAFFVGDDVTDERAFARLTGPDVGVKVGPGETGAPYRVQGPRDVALLLATLSEERATWLAGADAVPIEDLTLLADGVNTALLTPRGDVTWLCHPEPDSAALFADLLGGPGAGVLCTHPARGGVPLGQEYLGDTMTVRTRWAGLTLVDYLDRTHIGSDGPYRRVELVREVTGRTPARIVFAPRPEFGGVPVSLSIVTEDGTPLGIAVDGASEPVFLRAPGVTWQIHQDGQYQTATATVELEASSHLLLELRCGTTDRAAHPIQVDNRRAQTESHWRQWSAALALPPGYEREVVRSALTLKSLCHEVTGAAAAAATTSLPECVGGNRQWDYRYCWIRDAAMTVRALLDLGSVSEAEHFLVWLQGVLRDTPSPELLHPLYTVHGRRLGSEAVVEQLPGYAGSRPVRVGNAAQGQVQLDVFGPVADLIAGLVELRGGGNGAIRDHEWDLLQQMVSAVSARWHEPDHGVWEIRDAPRHHVYSKVMCWWTVQRALDVARGQGVDKPEWEHLTKQIATEVVERGWDATMNAYVSAYDRDELEATAMFVGLAGLLDANDPRFAATVDAVEDGLRLGPTVYRYRHDDGLPGTEGGMHICTAWLIEAYLAVGRHEDAAALYHDLIGLSGATGLLSEQYDPVAERALGNHPQAYSHLGVVRAALALSRIYSAG